MYIHTSWIQIETDNKNDNDFFKFGLQFSCISCSVYWKLAYFLHIISSSSYICHGVGPVVDPFRSHVSRILFKGLPCFLLPEEEQCFITLGNLLRGIQLTCCIQFLLYPCNLSKIGVIFNSFAICVFVLQSGETCQWLKFPLNGLRAQSRVRPVVGLLPLASGPAYYLKMCKE